MRNLTHISMAIFMLSAFSLQGCGSGASGSSSSSTEDTSASGAVAGVLGGSVNTGGSNTTLSMLEPIVKHQYNWAQLFNDIIPSAEATTQCPSIAGSATLGCAASGSGVALNYSGCHFGAAAASWTGGQLVLGNPAISCAENLYPAYTGTLTRYFGTATNSTNGMVRTAATGTYVTMDSGGSFAAADGTTYSGGVQSQLTNGIPTNIVINGVNLVGRYAGGAIAFSHSLSTTAPVVISGGVVQSGTVQTIHNLVKVKASSSVAGLTFTAGCCTPTSGTITTSFSSIPGVTGAVGLAYVGKTESLQFTGCGTAIYVGPQGYSGNVTISHCF